MNLLMVDDDAHVLESVKKKIDWESLKIQRIFSAAHVEGAKEILEIYPVDILLCDIEMPLETGLDLLTWVREKRLDIQVMMLTSYAEFQYAQKALSLECLEYFLKPVDYDKLTAGLKRAVQKVRENRKQGLTEKIRLYGENSREYMQLYFWNRMVSGAVLPVKDEIEREIRMQHLPYTSQDYVTACIVKLIVGGKEGDWEAENRVEWQDEVGRAFFEAYDCWGDERGAAVEAVVPLGKNMWAAVLSRVMGDERPGSVLGERLLTYGEQITGGKGICSLGDWCRMEDFYELVKELQELVRIDGCQTGRVICQWEHEKQEAPYCIPEIENWDNLLQEGKIECLKERVKLYLKRQQVGHTISRQMLKQFRLDMTQMIFSYLSQCGIQAHIVFHNARNDKLYRSAVNSGEEMWNYIEYLLDHSMAYKALSDRPQGAIEQVREYIDAHYNEELPRDELAAMIYLNPDYLSRRFKEEKGISISNYIIKRRVDKAKELLRESSMPINAVAMEVGYDNFAYFAKVFRSKTEMSPNEYRKSVKRS